ncbi:hypothetical protein F441_15261, partial [Phytophthora nicotianae CJ01A1]
MAPSAHVFVFDMGEGTTRFFMNRADPSTFEEAFTLELRKDNAVTTGPASCTAR